MDDWFNVFTRNSFLLLLDTKTAELNKRRDTTEVEQLFSLNSAMKCCCWHVKCFKSPREKWEKLFFFHKRAHIGIRETQSAFVCRTTCNLENGKHYESHARVIVACRPAYQFCSLYQYWFTISFPCFALQLTLTCCYICKTICYQRAINFLKKS